MIASASRTQECGNNADAYPHFQALDEGDHVIDETLPHMDILTLRKLRSNANSTNNEQPKLDCLAKNISGKISQKSKT